MPVGALGRNPSLARRAPHEGPRDFQARVACERPDLAAAVSGAIDRYVALRYAGGGDLRALREAVAAVRPGVQRSDPAAR